MKAEESKSDTKYTKIKFASGGLRFGALSHDSISIWSLDSRSGGAGEPVGSVLIGEGLHSEASDFVFINSGSLIAVAGGKGAAIYDSLIPPRSGPVWSQPSEQGLDSIAYLDTGPYMALGGKENLTLILTLLGPYMAVGGKEA